MTLQCLTYPTQAIGDRLRRVAPLCTRQTLPALGLVEIVESYVLHKPGLVQWRMVLCITHQGGLPYGEFVQMEAGAFRLATGSSSTGTGAES